MTRWTTCSPLFGVLNLVPHEAAETPEGPTVGYVDFGDDTKLTQGLFLNGRWCQRSGRPHKQPIARWYHVERPDGSRPF